MGRLASNALNRGRRPSDGRINDRESVPGRSLSGPDDRLREPEGRRRQDHDGGQSRELSGPRRRPGPRHRPRPPGQRHERLRPRPLARSTVRSTTRSSTTWRSSDLVVERAARRRPRSRPSIALAGAEVELAPHRSRERRLARLIADDRRPLRLHLHRLPAVARAPDRECPDRRRFGAHPAPMRVLRPGRTDPAARHDRPRPRPPEPRAGHRRRRADDVRRPDEPVGRRRRRGAPPPRAARSTRP